MVENNNICINNKGQLIYEEIYSGYCCVIESIRSSVARDGEEVPFLVPRMSTRYKDDRDDRIK